MSLTVRHLNGDTTFLLTFAPTAERPPSPPGPGSYQPPGTFTVLVDPWLAGPNVLWHPKFLLSRHTTPLYVKSLSQLPEPNIVLISQAKPDHCHEATLRQLDPTSPITTILAEPAAAKKILGMKHFHPSMVHSLRNYSEKKPDSVIRFFIPPVVPGGVPGEATISFIPAKIDVSGVHNAIGITYRPPSSTSIPSRPFSPSSSSYRQNGFPRPAHAPTTALPITPPDSPIQQTSSSPSNLAYSNSSRSAADSHPSNSSSNHNPSVSSLSSTSTASRPQAEKALSLIYSPHGVNYSLIRAYASSHLVQTAALPLTLLLHSFDRVNNPWWMGGNVAAGLPGGVEIAQNLMARCWISAHDEDKDNSGLAVMNVKTRKYTKEEVREMLWAQKGGNIHVANLGVGEEMMLKA